MATPLLVYGATAVFECIDPSTDLAVTGVTITDPVISGVNLSSTTSAITTTADVTPLWVPIPTGDLNDPATEDTADEPVAAGS